MSDKLILCQHCIHREVCGHEGVDDPALTFCDDYLPISGWISVKDRLPETGVHVLAACKVKIIGGGEKHYICDAFHTSKFSFIAEYCDDMDCDYNEETDEYYFPEGWWEVIKNWDDFGCVAIQDEVTHWMPLPEPPKEEK